MKLEVNCQKRLTVDFWILIERIRSKHIENRTKEEEKTNILVNDRRNRLLKWVISAERLSLEK